MRKTVSLILLLSLVCCAYAQQPQERLVYFTAAHKNGSAIDSLVTSDLKVPEGVHISRVDKVGARAMRYAIVLDNSKSREAVLPTQKELANLILKELMRDGVDYGAVVNFWDLSYLDRDFTTDTKALSAAVAKGEAHGGTALMQTVLEVSAHISKAKLPLGPEVIFLISDGRDNASHVSEEQTIGALEVNDVRVYAFALGDSGDNRANEAGAAKLERLTKSSGGRLFVMRKIKTLAMEKELALIRADFQNWFVARISFTAQPKKPFRIESKNKEITIESPAIAMSLK